MGSKLMGFRVADDLAEEIETKAAEEGLSVSELFRKLADEYLYPSKSDNGGGEVAELEGERMEDIQRQVDALGASVEHFGNHLKELAGKVELAQLNEGSAKMVEEELDRVEREAKGRHNRLAATINNNTAEVKRIVPIVEGKLSALKSDVARLEDRVATTERQVKRTPTGKIRELPNKDGTKSSFWVYKGRAGLIKPFEFDSGEYVDLSEPLLTIRGRK